MSYGQPLPFLSLDPRCILAGLRALRDDAAYQARVRENSEAMAAWGRNAAATRRGRQPMNLTDALDVLKNAVELESALRQAAAQEWATGDYARIGPDTGPMKKAHDASIVAAVEAAKKLIAEFEAPR